MIDLTAATFLDCASVGTLLRAVAPLRHDPDAAVVLAGATGIVKRLLDLLQLDRLFDILPDVEHAREHATAADRRHVDGWRTTGHEPLRVDQPSSDAADPRTPDGARPTACPSTQQRSSMADLTNLETKLGEVTGLAMAAQAATEKVLNLAKQDGESELEAKLQRMHAEAAETEKRCTKLSESFEGKKTAILEEARSTKAKGAEMMKTYLDERLGSLDGFEFLTMAEAGEVGHGRCSRPMNGDDADAQVAELVGWALPIQQRHLEDVMAASIDRPASEDPDETA